MIKDLKNYNEPEVDDQELPEVADTTQDDDGNPKGPDVD